MEQLPSFIRRRPPRAINRSGFVRLRGPCEINVLPLPRHPSPGATHPRVPTTRTDRQLGAARARPRAAQNDAAASVEPKHRTGVPCVANTSAFGLRGQS